MIFLENVCLHGAANILKGPGEKVPVLRFVRLSAIVRAKPVDLLVDCGIQEKSEHRWCRSVDSHGDGSLRVTQVESIIQSPHVIKRRNGHSGSTDLAVDIRPLRRISAI